MTMGAAERPTVRVSNIPQTATAHDLLHFLESTLGPDSVFAVEIATERKNWKSRGFGRVQFATLETRSKAQSLSLSFKSQTLRLSDTYDDIVVRPVHPKRRLENCVLHVGFMAREGCMSVLESWEGVRVWVMPERGRVEFWVWQSGECYKVEVLFQDVLEADRCCLGGTDVNALLLKVWDFLFYFFFFFYGFGVSRNMLVCVGFFYKKEAAYAFFFFLKKKVIYLLCF
jgi:RNA-dependent RNA polymerase